MYHSAWPCRLKIIICAASVPIITRNNSTSAFSAFCISGLTRIFSEEKSVNCHIWSFKFIFEFFNHQSEQIFNILYCQGLHITPSPVGPGDFFFHQVNIGLALALLRGLTKDDVRTGAWEEKKVIKFSLFPVHNFHGCYHSRRRQIEN